MRLLLLLLLLLYLAILFTVATTYYIVLNDAFLLSTPTIRQRQRQQQRQQLNHYNYVINNWKKIKICTNNNLFNSYSTTTGSNNNNNNHHLQYVNTLFGTTRKTKIVTTLTSTNRKSVLVLQRRKTVVKVCAEKDSSSSTSTSSTPETTVRTKSSFETTGKDSSTDHNITNDKNSVLTNTMLYYPFHCSPPYIALVTETITCDNDIQLTKSIQTISKAIHTNLIHLIYIRIPKSNVDSINTERKDRMIQLIQHLIKIRNNSQLQYIIVISSNWWIDCSDNTAENDNSNNNNLLLLRSGIDGIHFKESHRHLIPIVQNKWMEVHHSNLNSDSTTNKKKHLIVGTSTHTIQSTIDAYAYSNSSSIDYFIAGTCFFTSSHIEKQSLDDLEGPTFPHQVKVSLSNYIQNANTTTTSGNNNASKVNHQKIPPVFAIGGINETNCHIPFVLPQQQYQQDSVTTSTQNDSNNNNNYNYNDNNNNNSCNPPPTSSTSTINIDGIATISAILHSSDPEGTVKQIYNAMKQALQ